MTIKAIKTAVNKRIVEHGGIVYASETEEGFKRPCFFVDVFPTQTERISAAYEELTVHVEIHYESAEDTQNACIGMADKLLAWFSLPLEVGDRTLHAEEIVCETDDDITLYVSFDLRVTVDVPCDDGEEPFAPVMAEDEENLSFHVL